jgi:rubrerythrin
MNETSLIIPEGATSRRGLIRGTAKVALSAVAIAMLAGCEGMAQDNKMSMADIDILNTALGAEYQAIAAYQVGAESKLLQPAVLAVAVKFQGDHKKHAELLSSTVGKLGGTPVSPKAPADYHFPVETLHNQADVLKFAVGLERGAMAAYVGAVPAFANRDLAKAAATILADESIHFAVLRNALGEDPDPMSFYS